MVLVVSDLCSLGSSEAGLCASGWFGSLVVVPVLTLVLVLMVLMVLVVLVVSDPCSPGPSEAGFGAGGWIRSVVVVLPAVRRGDTALIIKRE